MFAFLSNPDRPKITAAQLVSGVPVFALLLTAFGVYDLSGDQQNALELTVGWAAALVLGDAGLRASRNAKDAKVEAAAINATTEPHDHTIPDADELDPTLPENVASETFPGEGEPVPAGAEDLELEPEPGEDPQ